MTSNTILYIENLCKYYEGHKAADGITLKIPANSIYGLLGPNGAGKTTLLRMVTGILLPDSGKMLYQGMPIRKEIQRKIGYLPEERGLYKKMKVLDQLIYLARLKGLHKKEAKLKALALLEKFGLIERQKFLVEELSKGMQQKIQFIATIIYDPELMILDEPFSGFDPLNAEMIQQEIKSIQSAGKTIILSSHRMQTIENLCDDLAFINKGKIVLEGSMTDIKATAATGNYIVESKEYLPEGKAYTILEKREIKTGHRYRLSLSNGLTQNQMFSELLSKMTISSIREEVPGLEEIFLQKISTDNQ